MLTVRNGEYRVSSNCRTRVAYTLIGGIVFLGRRMAYIAGRNIEVSTAGEGSLS